MSQESDRYAVFGHPVAHSRSPEIHHHFAGQTGEAITYERIDPGADGFVEAARGFFAEGGRGANVTVPFKEAALELADELTERAERAGAVNTLKALDNGHLLGDNTDGAGLVRDIESNLGFRLSDRRMLILGAGGAARGVLGPLVDAGIGHLHIANRTAKRAERLAERFRGTANITAGSLGNLPNTPFDLIVNATAASLAGETLDLSRHLLAPQALCYDMAYGPELTPFLQQALKHGAHVADGWGMLVEQAAESFHRWRDILPDTTRLIHHRG